MKFYRILILTFFTYTLISCGGADERKLVYMEKAKASIETGDLEKARIELKNVLQIDPKDGEAFYLLGSVFENQKDYRKAYVNYLKAEELSPELLSNHAKLGRFYLLLMNDSDKAQEKIDLILSKEPNNPEGQLLKAAISVRNKNTDEAIIIARDIISKNPGHAESAVFLAGLYLKENKIADAINVLDTALNKNQNDEKLNKILVLSLVKNKEYERAEVIYKKFLERNPNNNSSYNNLAIFYNQIGDKTKAEEVLRASIENDTNDVTRQLALVQYIRLIRSDDDAIKEVKDLIASHNDLGKLRLALAQLYITVGDQQSAIEIYDQAIIDFQEEVTSIAALQSLASIYIGNKDYGKASEVVEKAIVISPNDPDVNLIKAKLALNEKDYEAAILSLRLVLKGIPEKIEAYLLLAATYDAQGDDGQANTVMISAYNNNRTNPAALLQLSHHYMNINDAEQAEMVIDDYLAINDAHYEALSIKVTLLNKQKKFDEAKPLAKRLIKRHPDKSNGYVQSIPYLAEEKDAEKAVDLLKDGYEKVKDNKVILELLTSMQVRMNKPEEAKRRINGAIVKYPDDMDLHLLLAKIYITSKETSKAEDVLNVVIEKQPGNEEAYLLLANIHKNANDKPAYVSVLKEGNKGVPDSLKLAIALAGIYEIDKKYNDAIDVYEKLIISHPDNIIVNNNLASLLSDHKSDEISLNRAKELADKLKATDEPVLQDTVGWVYYRMGEYSSAIEMLKSAVVKKPNINMFNYHLGMAYKAAGDTVNAKLYLSKSLASGEHYNGKVEAEKALSEL